MTHRTLAIRQILGRGSGYTLASAGQLLARVLVLPVLTRALSVEQFGVVALALIAIQFGSILGSLGLHGAISILYFTEDGERKARRLIALVAVTTIVVLGVADLTGGLWAGLFGASSYGGELRIAVWAGLPLAIVLAVQATLQAANRVAAFVGLTALATVAAQGLGLVFVLAADGGAAGYLAGILVGYGVAALFGLGLVRPSASTARGGRLPGGTRSLIRAGYALGIPIAIHGLAGYVLSAGDRLVIVDIEGIDAVGAYQVAYVIGTLGLTLVVSLNRAWGPLILGARESERWQLLASTTAAIYRLAVPVAGGLAIAVPLALYVAAPSEYEPASLTPVAAIVAFTLVIQVGYLSRVKVLFQRQRTIVLAWATPLAAIVNVLMNSALVPLLSLEGAALATLVAEGLLFAILVGAARRLVTVEWQTSVTVRSWLLAGAAVAVGAMLPATGAWLAYRFVLGLGCLVWLAVVFKRVWGEPAARAAQ